jgi:hypothetical protein
MATAAEINTRMAELSLAVDPWEPLYQSIAYAGRRIGETISRRREKQNYDQSMKTFSDALAAGPGAFNDISKFNELMLGVISRLPSRDAQATASTLLSGIVQGRRDAIERKMEDRRMSLYETSTNQEMAFRNQQMAHGAAEEARRAEEHKWEGKRLPDLIAKAKAETDALRAEAWSRRMTTFGKTRLGSRLGFGTAPKAPTSADIEREMKAVGVSLANEMPEEMRYNADAITSYINEKYSNLPASHRGYIITGFREEVDRGLAYDKEMGDRLDREYKEMESKIDREIVPALLNELSIGEVGSIKEAEDQLDYLIQSKLIPSSTGLSSEGPDTGGLNWSLVRNKAMSALHTQFQHLADTRKSVAEAFPESKEAGIMARARSQERVRSLYETMSVRSLFGDSVEDALSTISTLTSLANAATFSTDIPDDVTDQIPTLMRAAISEVNSGGKKTTSRVKLLTAVAKSLALTDPAKAEELYREAKNIQAANKARASIMPKFMREEDE